MKRTCAECYWSKFQPVKTYRVWCVINHVMVIAHKHRPNCKHWSKDKGKEVSQ